MHFNLLEERWIPVIRADGSRERIAPWEITGGDAPPVDLAPPRPDFRAALLEMLIGLLQTACPPARAKDWRRQLKQPPTPEALRKALAPHAPFFNLFGPKPLFMQDFTLELPRRQADYNDVATLLIDAPGEQTQRKNGDFFVKRGGVPSLCPACAAMALFTLQAFAPSGGKGNRTSLRGGGPLSTLMDGATLWEKIWLNVLPLSAQSARVQAAPGPAGLPGKVYPWAAPTRESSKGEETHPGDAHFLHAYWGMPRRLILRPEEATQPTPCALCATETTCLVRHYHSRPYGTNYGSTWRHPLSPYREQGQGKPTLAVKGTTSIAGYAHWLGIVYGQPAEGNGVRRAGCVESALDLLQEDTAQERPFEVCAAGYDMDNMKALQWCESRFPCYAMKQEHLPEFRIVVDKLVEAAEAVRRNLVGLLKEALVNEAGRNQAKTDKTLFETAGKALWSRTEADFYSMAGILAEDPDWQRSLPLREEWSCVLYYAARKIFEEHTGRGRMNPERIRRVVEAGRSLDNFNRKKMRDILGLPRRQGASHGTTTVS